GQGGELVQPYRTRLAHAGVAPLAHRACPPSHLLSLRSSGMRPFGLGRASVVRGLLCRSPCSRLRLATSTLRVVRNGTRQRGRCRVCRAVSRQSQPLGAVWLDGSRSLQARSFTRATGGNRAESEARGSWLG